MYTKDATAFGSVILSAISSTAPETLPAIVRSLVKAGDVDAIEAIEQYRLVDLDILRDKGQTISLEFTYSVLPLLNEVSSGSNARVNALVTRWLAWCGGDDPKLMERFLTTCTDTQVVEALIERDGHRLDTNSALTRHVRKSIREEKPVALTVAFIKGLAKYGNHEPYIAALRELASSCGDSNHNLLMSQLNDIRVDGEIREDCVDGIVADLTIQHQELKCRAFNIQNLLVWTGLSILDKLPLTDNQWQAIAQTWSSSTHVFNVMCDYPTVSDASARAVSRMLAAGVDRECFKADLKGKRDPVPMIYRAAFRNNLQVVQCLHQLGESTPAIKLDGKLRTPFDLAPPGSETAQFFLAQSARHAMRSAVARSTCGHNPS